MKRFVCAMLTAAVLLLAAGCGSVALPGEAGDALRQVGDSLRSAEDTLEEAKELLKSTGAEAMLDELKELMNSSGQYSDAELEQALRNIAAKKGLALNDAVMPQLIKLIRSVEKGVSFKNRVEETKDKVDDAAKSVKDLFGK